MVDIGTVALEFAIGTFCLGFVDFCLYNVRIGVWDCVEKGFIDAEVFRENRFRGVLDPVINGESGSTVAVNVA